MPGGNGRGAKGGRRGPCGRAGRGAGGGMGRGAGRGAGGVQIRRRRGNGAVPRENQGTRRPAPQQSEEAAD